MKPILFIPLMLFFFSAFSQKNSVGLQLLPGSAYRHLEGTNNNFSEPDDVPAVSYSITTNYERKFNKNASFLVGITFIKASYQSNKKDIRYSVPMPNPEFYAFRNRYTFNQLGIPVGVNWFIPIKKINLIFSAGVSTNYLINVKYTSILYATNGNDNVKKTDDDMEFYKSINLGAFASMGVEAKINTNYTLRLTPSLYYNFTNIMSDNMPFKQYLNSAAIGLGVYRQF